MRRKTNISLLLCLSMILSLAGCADTKTEQSVTTDITLIEPVNAAANYEEPAYRNLYDAKIYAATIVPYVEEYSSEDGMQFDHYGAYPGEVVEKGRALIHSDQTAIDKQIEDMETLIENTDEAYEEYKADIAESIKSSDTTYGNLKYCVEAYEKVRPEEYVDASTVTSGDSGQVKNPEYISWEIEYNKYIGPYRILDHSRNTLELQLAQRTELYELDRAHYVNQLNDFKKKKNEAAISTEMSGEVVAMNMFSPEDYINKDVTVTAVGDMSQKLLKCDYINKATVEKASDVYAFIDGVRYEVEYQAMETDEYVRLTAQGETVHSTFKLLNAGEEVKIGDFAVISLVNNSRTQVLTISKSAIHKDDTGNYVYVVTDAGNVYTPIKTGMSDGVYTEVLSGITENDKVLVDSTTKVGDNIAKVERSNFNSEYMGRGMMYYPSSSILKNPIENGTVYFVSTEIETNQHVEKGDVIATVRVAADSIALNRNETKKARLLERINDLEKLDAEANKKEIESKREQVAELEETIAEQKADFATTQIRADRSGVVIWMEDYDEEDILLPECNIMEIADESTCYVLVENTNQILQYGNMVTIDYTNGDNQKCSVEGKVVSLSQVGVSASMVSEYSYILLPQDKIEDMSRPSALDQGWWSRYRYDVTATVREMNNVLVVPKKAVSEINGRTYVNIVTKDGKKMAHSFIAGGYNSQYYWVVDGLTEGMEVCLE